MKVTLLSLTHRCPGQRSAWLKALPDITQLDSALSRTRSAWLSAVPDITQLHLVNLWVVVIVYINTFLTKQYIVGSGSGCGIVPWRSRDFFHFFTHKKLSQDFACNKNIFFTFNARKRLYFISVSSCVSSTKHTILTDFKLYLTLLT